MAKPVHFVTIKKRKKFGLGNAVGFSTETDYSLKSLKLVFN